MPGDEGDIHRLLGRLDERSEQQGKDIQRILSNGEARDEAMRAMETRLHNQLGTKIRDAVHDTKAEQQVVIGKLDRGLTDVQAKLSALDTRTAKLEAPVKRAMASRASRRKLYGRAALIAASVASGFWLFFEPVWKALAEPVSRIVVKWMGGAP